MKMWVLLSLIYSKKKSLGDIGNPTLEKDHRERTCIQSGLPWMV